MQVILMFLEDFVIRHQSVQDRPQANNCKDTVMLCWWPRLSSLAHTFKKRKHSVFKYKYKDVHTSNICLCSASYYH